MSSLESPIIWLAVCALAVLLMGAVYLFMTKPATPLRKTSDPYIPLPSLIGTLAQTTAPALANNPTAYDLPMQVGMWGSGPKPTIGTVPNQNLIDQVRGYEGPQEMQWGTFWNPIPDPLYSSRPVYWDDDPVSSGMRAHIVETGMSGGNPMCGRGGYPGQ